MPDPNQRDALTPRSFGPGKFSGLSIQLMGLGRVRLTTALAHRSETGVYHTDHPGVVVKMFDLSCGKPDEVSYGPYMGFQAELANFEEVLAVESLRSLVPSYYGAHIDYQHKHAFIAMEFLEGQDLLSWCNALAQGGHPVALLAEFGRAAHEVLAIMSRLHEHGYLLLDFKPENVIMLPNGTIKLVDLDALYTPRHRDQARPFVYSATPDHAEVLIDASNLQAGVPPTAASDVFSAGVALFEMATGTSRLLIAAETAEEMLATPELFLFRDSQIRDVWQAYPHLKEVLPLVHTQLVERRLLFAEVWHLFKAYLGKKVAGWESFDPPQHDQVLLATGTTFIMEQLPAALGWLAGPIAAASVLRSLRLPNLAALEKLLTSPAPEETRADIEGHSCFLKYLRGLELPVAFTAQLNTWDVRLDPASSHWAVSAPFAGRQVAENAEFLFLRQLHSDAEGHRYYHVVEDFEADEIAGRKLTLQQISHDHSAWLGGAPPGD